MSTSSRGRIALIGLLAGSGALHFVRPGLFRSMVPQPLPYKHELVLASGTVARLPLQVSLLRSALRTARGGR